MTVERMGCLGGDEQMAIFVDGEFVYYTDYEKLEAENEALKAEIYTLKNPVSSLISFVLKQRRLNDEKHTTS